MYAPPPPPVPMVENVDAARAAIEPFVRTRKRRSVFSAVLAGLIVGLGLAWLSRRLA